MTFNDTTTKDGLIQSCEFKLFGDNNYGTISGNTNKMATFTRLLNRAYDRVTAFILTSDGRWQHDDTGFTDYPIATTSLVANQKDYQFAVEHIRITRVEAKDENGDWRLLIPIDQNDVPEGLAEFMDVASIPQYYDKLANSLFLYPSPNYNSSGGLKVYYQRVPDYFVVSDTSKTPGFVTLFHDLLATIACHEYAIAQTLKQKKADLFAEMQIGEAQIKKFYSKRQSDEPLRITRRHKNYR